MTMQRYTIFSTEVRFLSFFCYFSCYLLEFCMILFDFPSYKFDSKKKSEKEKN